jgi:hypothetical protein
MDRWRSEPVTKADLEAVKLPVSDGWFEDAFGQPVARVWFDYLRDHLGYRLEVREATWPRSAAAGTPPAGPQPGRGWREGRERGEWRVRERPPRPVRPDRAVTDSLRKGH